jgi:outer membrane protein OmpA-like peptidoglycan-associated protein
MTIHKWVAFGLAVLSMPSAPSSVPAQGGHAPNAPRIALARGLTVSETERGRGGERESVTLIDDASAAGVKYVWHYREIHDAGDTIVGQASRFVSAADLATAQRIHLIYDPKGSTEHPGYTAWSISTAVYQQLRSAGSAPFQMMSGEPPLGVNVAERLGVSFGSASALVPVRWRGTLTRVGTAPESFPLLVNGRRVTVPALHARAQFMGRGQQWTPELWVLADSAHPMLLKVTSKDPPKEFQVVRVDMADDSTVTAGARGIERDLTIACRAELPGIYFAFNSAALDPASDRTIAAIAAILARHRDWKVIIEGHTDSIGGVGDNQALSERRAASVRERLVSGHRLDPSRLGSVGHAASQPREPNATIEGRARNRRVELVRACTGPSR